MSSLFFSRFFFSLSLFVSLTCRLCNVFRASIENIGTSIAFVAKCDNLFNNKIHTKRLYLPHVYAIRFLIHCSSLDCFSFFLYRFDTQKNNRRDKNWKKKRKTRWRRLMRFSLILFFFVRSKTRERWIKGRKNWNDTLLFQNGNWMESRFDENVENSNEFLYFNAFFFFTFIKFVRMQCYGAIKMWRNQVKVRS